MNPVFDDYSRLIIHTSLITGIGVFLFTWYKSGTGAFLNKNRENKNLKKRVLELESKVDSLTSANTKYATFVMKFADAAKFLSSNHSFEEAASSIVRLVEDIIPAECIGLYIYNRTSESLKLASAFGGEIRPSKNIYLMGEGMVGAAAKNKMLLSNDSYHSSKDTNGKHCQPQFATPILFKDELIGVISISGVKIPHGDEKMLLAMVAGIGGVSLRNALIIDDVRQEAATDPLTKLYNRRFLFQRAQEELVRARGYSSPVSFFLFDIDHFKHYNDTNGHLDGDRLLASLAVLLKSVTRKTSILARYGGEEFLALLPNIDKEAAYIYAERIRKLIESSSFPHREKQPLGVVSISGGISEFPSDGDTLEELIRLADSALYQSKKAGRNRIKKASE